MPHFVVERVTDALNPRRKSINGAPRARGRVAYKQDVNDLRESPGIDVLLLSRRGPELLRSVRSAIKT